VEGVNGGSVRTANISPHEQKCDAVAQVSDGKAISKMGNFVLIYDSSDANTKNGAAEAKRVGATPYPITNALELLALFKKLKNIEHMVIYSHGEPGTLSFKGGRVMTTREMRTDFLPESDFEQLFAQGAVVEFQGCNIADITDGCDLPALCSETDNGVVFLKEFARKFLKRGGRATGNTSAGFSVDLNVYKGTKIHHLWGIWIHALVNPNQRNYGGVRMAIGKQLPGPDAQNGAWRVWDGKEFFYYTFRPVGTETAAQRHFGVAYWCTDDEWQSNNLKGLPRTPDRRGSWWIEKDFLRIQWNTEVESWDLPLFDAYQTGIAKSNIEGMSVGFRGIPGVGGTGDVWAEAVDNAPSILTILAP
jgi:hypothetical protein